MAILFLEVVFVILFGFTLAIGFLYSITGLIKSYFKNYASK